jgi:hypothetical protein
MQIVILLLPRAIAGVSGGLLGTFCVTSAYEYGFEFAGTPSALGFAALVVGCWFIPAINRTTTPGTQALGWFVFIVGTCLVLVTSLGNAARHRSANVGAAQTSITTYENALKDLARLTAELDTMKANPKKPGEPHPRWVASAGCSNITLPESADYCAKVADVKKQLQQASAVTQRGRPLSADPQAASLRKFIDATPDEINEWLPILLALGLEIAATGLMTMAFAPFKLARAPEKPQEAPQLEAPADPAWMSSTPLSGGTFPRLTKANAGSTPLGTVDGRALRWLPTNPRLNDNDQAA